MKPFFINGVGSRSETVGQGWTSGIDDKMGIMPVFWACLRQATG
jgi:hypothetical protein